jgi:cytidine deaminase
MTEWNELLEKAREVQKKAYSPYSKFRVGAALEGVSGRIYQGCNIENASYRVTTCAEQSAISVAIAAGERNFTRLAIVADSPDPAAPCGACRQALVEFAPDLEVYSVSKTGVTQRWNIQELIPMAFTWKSLFPEQPE